MFYPNQRIDTRQALTQAKVERLEEDVLRQKHINEDLRKQLDALLPSAVQSRASVQAFQLPDIAESIFLQLGVLDLLAAQSVCRTWFRMIEYTSSLQRKLFLLADDKGQWRSFPAGILHDHWIDTQEYFELSGGDYLGHSDGNWRFSFNLHVWPKAHNFKAGERIRNMLVWQPPVQQIWVETSCCGRLGYGPSFRDDHGGVIRNSAGIRLSDLLDHAKFLHRHHTTCPHAHDKPYNCGDDGVPATFVGFYLKLKAGKEHPLMAAELARRRRHCEKLRLLDLRKQGLLSTWAAFDAAKSFADAGERGLEWHTWLRSQQHEQEASGSTDA